MLRPGYGVVPNLNNGSALIAPGSAMNRSVQGGTLMPGYGVVRNPR
jgi:hypothetical protein